MLLLYCVLQPDLQLPQISGVRATPLQLICGWQARIACASSEAGEQLEFSARDAVIFYRAVNAVFRQKTVIPFRFPTLLRGPAEVSEYLDHNGPHLAAELERLQGTAQMDVLVRFETSSAGQVTSGAEYLRKKSESGHREKQAVHELQALTAGLVLDWRERRESGMIRCSALVRREMANEFSKRLANAGEKDYNVRVTGPWPPAEFVEAPLAAG